MRVAFKNLNYVPPAPGPRRSLLRALRARVSQARDAGDKLSFNGGRRRPRPLIKFAASPPLVFSSEEFYRDCTGGIVAPDPFGKSPARARRDVSDVAIAEGIGLRGPADGDIKVRPLEIAERGLAGRRRRTKRNAKLSSLAGGKSIFVAAFGSPCVAGGVDCSEAGSRVLRKSR